MRTSTLAVASILAAAVSAQSVPASCERVATLVQSCAPDGTTEQDPTGTVVANCLCSGGTSFDNDVVDCIKEAGSLLPADLQSSLEAFRGYCSLFAGGGGGSPGNTGSPTSPSETSDAAETSEPSETGPAETGEPVPTGSENCNYIVQGLSRCWTDDSPLPTAAPVARCLCSGTNFDSAIEGCYSDIVDDNPKEASTFAAFASFCSSFSNGAFGGSGPTVTGDDTATTGAPDPTSEDSTSTGRVIQTLDPETTGPSTTGASTTGGGNGPNSAAGLKVTVLGTALAAIFAGAALIL